MDNYIKNKTCCFIGHRKISKTDRLKNDLRATIEDLIINKDVNVFLFGSRSAFNDLCFETVTGLKDNYPHIRRIYVRAEYPYINDDYRSFLLRKYEDTYYPKNILKSGRAVYIERNCEMIDKSGYCVCYYDAAYLPPERRSSRRALNDYQPKSGTGTAYGYAVKKRLNVINMFKND